MGGVWGLETLWSEATSLALSSRSSVGDRPASPSLFPSRQPLFPVTTRPSTTPDVFTRALHTTCRRPQAMLCSTLRFIPPSPDLLDPRPSQCDGEGN